MVRLVFFSLLLLLFLLKNAVKRHCLPIKRRRIPECPNAHMENPFNSLCTHFSWFFFSSSLFFLFRRESELVLFNLFAIIIPFRLDISIVVVSVVCVSHFLCLTFGIRSFANESALGENKIAIVFFLFLAFP